MMPVAATSYVPDTGISVDGAPLPASLRSRITAVRFEEALEGAGRVEISFADPGLALLERVPFDLDSRLELALGYQPAGLRPVFTGEICGLEPTFPESGVPTLRIAAQDASQRLVARRTQRGFPWQATDLVIATIVAAESGLIARPDAAAALVSVAGLFSQRPRFQHKQTDQEFLRCLAKELGFEMWLDGHLLNFRPLLPGLPQAEIELRWGASLLEFAPRESTIGQVVAVRVRGWIEALRTEIAVEVAWEGAGVRVSVRPTTFAPPGEEALEAVLDLVDVPLDSPVEAVRVALAELRRKLNGRITATGSAVGDPRFRVGSLVAVEGVGRYSGRTWRLTNVAHSFDGGGYRTSFGARKEVV